MVELSVNLPAPEPPQFSEEFLLGMAKRMITSFYKYGDIREAYPHRLNAVGSALMRLVRYLGPEEFRRQAEEVLVAMATNEAKDHRREHGNTEYLIDSANFLMIEFMLPRHANAYFVAEDSSASPGRIANDGRATGGEANTASRENVRLGAARGQTSGGFYRREGD